MKQLFKKISLAIIVAFNLVACSKVPPPINPTPGPGETPASSRLFRLVIDSLPGMANEPVANLFAQLEIKNDKNEVVKSNQLLAINFQQGFKTETMELPAGNYKISKLLVQTGTGKILYATPLVGSVKAGLVKRPLAYSIKIPNAATLDVAADFLKILPGDKATDFGYDEETFPAPVEEDQQISIRIKTSIKVGDILYDSIPSTLVYRSWDAKNDFKVRIIHLNAGINTVALDKGAERHDFIVKKWNKDYNRTISKTELRKNALYVFGEEKEAKLLKNELVYLLVNGTYKADTKNSYYYNDEKQLTRIEYLRKREATNAPYIAMKEEFVYSNGKAERINRFDENGVSTCFTSFEYNGNGKVSRITEQDNNITKTAAVVHHPVNADGITSVNFNYTYSHNSNNLEYYQRFRNGNIESENSRSSNNSTENAVYSYDENINPFVHMGWPNLFLSNSSKNNIISQQRTYFGNYPANVVYSFEYKYDGDGYPIELIRRYKSYITGQHLFITKTVYNY